MRIEKLTTDKVAATKQMLLTVWNESLGLSMTMQEAEHYFLDKDFGEQNRENPSRYDLFLVLLDGDEVVGSGAVKRVDEKICELKRLWILKPYRNRGYGKRIVHLLVEYAQQQGYQLMQLELYDPEKQARAIAFYRKLGFYEIPNHHSEPRFCMEKLLNAE